MGSVVLDNRDNIIQQVAQGRRLTEIAKDLGLSGKGQAICNQLSKDPEYQAARESGLASRLDKREEELETCAPQDVPRARELLSHARWRCEREAPRVWGSKQELTVTNVSIDINGLLNQRMARIASSVSTVDSTATVIDEQDAES
jgi:hypothetical protein